MVIEFGNLPLTTGTLELVPQGKFLKIGNRIGWLGFPSIASRKYFFRECISAWLESDLAYLLDGVANNCQAGSHVLARGGHFPTTESVKP